MSQRPLAVKALVFDVFGTVVDWRGSIIREGQALGRRKKLKVDWPAFADAWRAGYRPAMARVRSGELPWTKIDDLHRLKPWPDARAGLAKLKRKHVIATLSNGNVALLTNMAKHAKLPWDCILSAEVVRHYKPDPETYLGAADLLGVKPAELMMVAAHKDDLHAARACGLKTAFVPRPKEYGPAVKPDVSRDPAFDIHARDFNDLARQLAR